VRLRLCEGAVEKEGEKDGRMEGEDGRGGWEDEQDEEFSRTRMEWDETKWDEDERMA